METPKEDQISSMLQQAIAAAERANLRCGQIPEDHPDPQAVVNKFMQQRFTNQLAYSKNDIFMLTTSQVPPSYAPSVYEADDLTPMSLSQMQLQIHHRGRKVMLRVITPQDTMNATMAVAEDEKGIAVLLQLYHQFKPSTADPEDMLRPNMVLVVKEPFFKTAGDGAYSIRYSHAVRAAETPQEEQLAYLNRSLANLRLNRPEIALGDASNAAKIEQHNEKALFREAKALYELGRFAESSEKLRMVTELEPVTVRKAGGVGNGLFTTKSVKVEDLLLCEKVFAYCYADQDDPIGRRNMIPPRRWAACPPRQPRPFGEPPKTTHRRHNDRAYKCWGVVGVTTVVSVPAIPDKLKPRQNLESDDAVLQKEKAVRYFMLGF
ncbi:hypothetical protein F5Y14DRAFT_446319 [Nemania sp. NC0429]|nr:hypothetical protein F5Y14DRAFT_446319 [Nemania sp. NC0429]